MAGPGSQKRKRTDDEGPRAAPYRPQDTDFSGPQRGGYRGGRGGDPNRGNRRHSRGGRGGTGGHRGGAGQRQDGRNSWSSTVPSPTQNFSNAMSPPPTNTSNPPNTEDSYTRQTPLQSISVNKPNGQATSEPNNLQKPDVEMVMTDPHYDWGFLTDDLISDWLSTGKQAVLEMGLQARQDHLKFGNLIQELLRAGLDGRLDPIVAGHTLGDIIGINATKLESQINGDGEVSNRPIVTGLDRASLFADHISAMSDSDTKKIRLRTIISATGISLDLLREQIDTEILVNLALVRPTFGRMGIRKQTNLIYRQQNYNLLREESEGFSKLITELFNISGAQVLSSDVVEATFERMKALIGAFDLDVGRVLDITLDVFASVLVKQYRFFVKLLRLSSWWPKESSFEGIETVDLGFDSLPQWAQAESSSWTVSEEQQTIIAGRREERDRTFWNRAREVGMDAFFELGGRRVIDQQVKDALCNGDAISGVLTDEDREWVRRTGTIPPQGNRIAAQLLGFKLKFYASEARAASEVLPENLVMLAALLIKIGFISFKDLYPHLYPADEDMTSVKELKMAENAEKEKMRRPGAGVKNALLTAGALSDDKPPPPGTSIQNSTSRGVAATRVDEKPVGEAALKGEEKLAEAQDQKVQLLRSLLAIGAIPEALYMLGRFPWLMDAFAELSEYVHRIVHHSLSKVYEPTQLLGTFGDLQDRLPIPDVSSTTLGKQTLSLYKPPARKTLRWGKLDKEDMETGNDYRFYWDDWADNVPICQSIDDVFLLCDTFLKISGVRIGRDVALLTKLARIGKWSIDNNTSDANVSRWIDLSKRLLVPALSLTGRNASTVNEVYRLVKCFPMTVRYSIYAEWNLGATSRNDDIRAAFELTKAETKDVLKRISKTTVKTMARALSKVAYSSPGVVFSVSFDQMEAYDNLTETFVECARYLTDLAYDMLTWSLMTSIGGKNRNRVQADGMLTSKWLNVLSAFAGKAFKRYSNMNPAPILHYITDQLCKSNFNDLVILTELISSMGGIRLETNFSFDQTVAMTGGNLLRHQTLLQLHDARHESKTTSRRLTESLTDSGLAAQILISMAQARQTCIFGLPEPDSHLKLLGNLFDETNRALAQYLEFLLSNLNDHDWKIFPDVTSLILDYGLDPNVAFWVSRRVIRSAIAGFDTQKDTPNGMKVTQLEKEADPSTSRKDENMNDVVDSSSEQLAPSIQSLQSEVTAPQQRPEADATQEKLEDAAEVRDENKLKALSRLNGASPSRDGDTAMKGGADNPESPISTMGAGSSEAEDPWHPVLKPIMEKIKPSLADDEWAHLSLGFFVTFWQLSLADLGVPEKSYLQEITRLRTKYISVNSDRSDTSLAGRESREREKKHIDETSHRLKKEMEELKVAFRHTRSRLLREKSHWFVGLSTKPNQLAEALLEKCFIPRLILTPEDAIFCSRIIKFMHANATPKFKTIALFDAIFRKNQIANLVFTCTAREAENLGTFLTEVLSYLSRWHKDKDVYEKEAYGPKRDLAGFSTKTIDGKPVEFDYEDFRRILFKWHNCLTNALKACLSSHEYMHIRNAIILLRAINTSFPAVNFMGIKLLEDIKMLGDDETREDLKLAAKSLYGSLKRRDKEWMFPMEFCILNQSQQAATEQRASLMHAESAHIGGKILDAKAQEFRPGPQQSSSSVKPASESDDGEIDEKKTTEVSAQALEVGVIATKSSQTTTPKDLAPGASKQIHTVIQNDDMTSGRREASPIGGRSTPRADQAQISANNSRGEDRAVISGSSEQSQSIPHRPDSVRQASANSLSNRHHSSLPNRPDPPSTRMHDRRVMDRREPQYSEHGRLERPINLPQELPRDHRDPTLRRGPERSGGRPPTSDWNHQAHGWSGHRDDQNGVSNERHTRPPPRSATNVRGGGTPEHGGQTQKEWPTRDVQNNGARTPPAQARQTRNTVQEPMTGLSRPSNINHAPRYTERAPFIQNDRDRHSDPGRDINDRRDNGPRTSSPRRTNETRNTDALRGPPYRPEDRNHTSDRINRADATWSGHGRPEDSRAAPTGPRGERPGWNGPPGSPSSFSQGTGDMFASNAAHSRPSDRDHVRLSRDLRQASSMQESSYGRLNRVSDIPSGPRAPSSQGEHNVSNGSQQSADARQPDLSNPNHNRAPSSSERPPPTGPSGRSTRRSGQAQFDPPSAPSSAPPTPVTDSKAPDLLSVHPDRRPKLQKTSDASGNTRPASLDTHSHAYSNAAQLSSPVIGGPPSGPRNPMQQTHGSAGISPTLRDLPAGPNERDRGDQRRFQGLNGVLQQAAGSERVDRFERGGSTRGRGGRGGYSAFTTTQNNPPLTSGRSDIYGDWMKDSSAAPSLEEKLHGQPIPPRDVPRESERRSARHHPSRSQSRDRGSLRPENERAPRREENRDRRSGARDEREHRRPRDDGRDYERSDIREGRDPREEFKRRESDDPRGWAVEGKIYERPDERDVRPEGPGSGRKRGRGGEEPMADRRFNESKRPRRT